ncbi:MAG: alkaline phosphatase D family protein, partial [Halobacteria archaeon]|nr:alkaline phosphatase D family protein [Halobacteria archaeon]
MSGDATGGETGDTVSNENAARNHGELVSLLSERDLALSTELHKAEDSDVFDFDAQKPASDVFPQSVASGGPTPEGVILWTRINPDFYDRNTPLAVEVSDDSEFDEPVFKGVVDDQDAIRQHDYTVKVDLDGVLEPDSEYFYRFIYDGTASKTGRCRTLPAPGSNPDSVSFAVVTCQNYLNGYYGVFHHISEEDIDFVIHVGDFIYESASGDFKGRGTPELDGRSLELPSGNDRVYTLEDYRYLYREYKSDPLLQEALENHTLIPARDDHEIANDIHWDYEDDAPKADHPQGDDPEFMTRLTADGIHTWWEYMPARIEYDPNEDGLQDRFQLWRSLGFGDLVDIIMTDERLFRCPPKDDKRFPLVTSADPEDEDDDRTMLGDEQLEWLKNELRDSDAVWTVWSDEVPIAPIRLGLEPLSLYPVQVGWDGYVRERDEIAEVIDESVDNFVSLTGDLHCY